MGFPAEYTYSQMNGLEGVWFIMDSNTRKNPVALAFRQEYNALLLSLSPVMFDILRFLADANEVDLAECMESVIEDSKRIVSQIRALAPDAP